MDVLSAPPAVAVGPEPFVPATAPATLAEVLRRAAEAEIPGRIVRVGREGGEVVLDYRQARDRAERVLGGLRARGARPGDEVILQAETADELAPALWACILGGFTAVPVGVVADDRSGQAARRLREAWAALDAPRVIAGSGLDGSVRDVLGPAARVLPLDELAAHAPDPVWLAAPPEAVAVLLLSSGTTGRPRLIQRSHHNLLCVCQRNPAMAGMAAREITFLNWLPLDHNAGLTSSLVVFATGADQVQLGTRDVLERPAHWLDCIHHYRATHTGGTNYSLGALNEVLAVGADRGWDLSCVQSFVLSGEPVVARTLRDFAGHTARYGLRPEALRPAYGMSEAGGITRLMELPPAEGGDAFVAAGTPYPGISLRVVDAEGRVVREGREGRVQVRGDTVTPGYARDPEETRARFTADGWFDTGDAGFLRGGTLTLTGREKDVLIVNGLNLQSQEVEAAVETVEGVELGRTAVCAVRLPGRDTDAAAVFLHTPRTEAAARDALRREVRRVVAARFGATVAHVLLVGRDALPRTALGKVQRSALRRRLEAGDFADAREEDAARGGGEGRAAPRNEVERALCAAWAEVLGVDGVGIHDDFLELGGHSLVATRVAARVRAALGVELPLRVLFEAPTVAALAERVETLRRAALPPVVPVERTASIPLSFAQERLWLLSRLEPESAAYNQPLALRLDGAIDVAALERALGEVVRRHEVLRATFPERGGAPVQAVAPFAGFALPVDDLSSTEPGEREAAAARIVAREAARPIDLASGPVFAARLLRLEDHDHVLFLCLHHLVTDAWSTGVLTRELWTLYDAFRGGRPSPLPDPAVQYADYAAWQRAHLRGEALERQLAYWAAHLAGAPPLLELPTDRPRPPVRTHWGGRVPVALPAALAERLEVRARAEGATPYMVLLAAFQVLLAKYAGTEDLVVGSAIAGRTRAELEGVVGFFVNTLALRADLSGDPDFRTVLRRVREAVLGAHEHQDAPFERVVEALRPRRSTAYAPLFQVMFVLDPDRRDVPRPGVRTMEVERPTARFDLTLTLARDPGGLRGELEYAADLFDRETIVRMVGHLERVLARVADDAGTRISALALVSPAERARVVEEWNRTETEYRADALVHRLIEDQAARTPDAVAVMFEDESLTYRQLDARADRLAHHLARLGAGPESRVAVSLPRGTELVVSLLAVLKAGAAYLPLDPSYPHDRLAYMLEDSGARLLVTEEALRGLLPAGTARVVAVDADAAAIAASPPPPPATPVAAGDLAYVIYTSGSTGRPKGVQVTHANVASFFAGMDGRVGGTVPGTWLAVTHVSFDIHVLELLWTLARGFRVVVQPEPDRVRPGGSVPEQLRRHAVTHLQCTPSLAAMLVAEAGVEALSGLDRLLLGGEALPPELAARITARFPGILVNLYGPTETTVWSATHPVERADGPVPIGRPIANTRVYVLDAALGPQPVGVPGELLIGGPGVTRGYLGRPALTAERFVPDPFGDVPGARLYRTGDRARWRGDGVLEYQGRLDAQVKVRGFRIEPGEVESVLRRHPDVAECVVAARPGPSGEVGLVAYVVGAADADALRAHAARALPAHMVPGAFVALEALPLTPNGKLDRAALPAPEAVRGAPSLPPRNAVEHRVAEVWRDVLGIPGVGISDNFFDLGGTSLLLHRVFVRLREMRGDLRMVDLFRYPTVEALAAHLESAAPGGAAELAESRARAEERRAARRRPRAAGPAGA